MQVKAWCYYESRLLGAHHGLISTYALETLVLYVFNKYHDTIDSPLSVRTWLTGSCMQHHTLGPLSPHGIAREAVWLVHAWRPSTQLTHPCFSHCD